MCDCVQLPSVSVTSSGCVEGRSSVEHHGQRQGQRRNIPAERQTNLHRTQRLSTSTSFIVIYLIFCFLGLSTHPFFFSVLLFDVVYREETLLNVIR
jgi:hypothetical protein